MYVGTLFRNKIFLFDEMKYLNASRFATFLGYEDPEKKLRKMKKTTIPMWFSYSKNVANFEGFHLSHFIKHKPLISGECKSILIQFR